MFFNPIVVISKLSACVEGIFVAEEEVGEFIEDEVGVMGAGLWGWVFFFSGWSIVGGDVGPGPRFSLRLF
jgi:hypothetical protein